MIFDITFMWFNCPAMIWYQLSAFAKSLGVCEDSGLLLEIILASTFTLTIMLIEMMFFSPIEYIMTFAIRKPFGFSSATPKSFIVARFSPIITYLLIFVPVINIFTVVLEWQKDNLILAIVIGTALVKLTVLFLYPILIKPIFSRKVAFPDDGDTKMLL